MGFTEMPVSFVLQVLANFGKLSVKSAQKYIGQITRGLRYLHDSRVLHRDVKPGNVLVEQGGICKLADFGTALLHKEVDQNSETIIGTPHYMAPETVRGQVCMAADVWALGVTLWEMLEGSMWDAYESLNTTSDIAVLFRLGMMTEAPPIPERFPVGARDFLQACLKVDPDCRATARELMNDPFLQ